MAKIGMRYAPGVFKQPKHDMRLFLRAYNKRVTTKSVEKSLASTFGTHGGNAARACAACGHTATDHRYQETKGDRRGPCEVPDCTCPKYQAAKPAPDRAQGPQDSI